MKQHDYSKQTNKQKDNIKLIYYSVDNDIQALNYDTHRSLYLSLGGYVQSRKYISVHVIGQKILKKKNLIFFFFEIKFFEYVFAIKHLP